MCSVASQSTFRLGIVQSGRLHLSDPLEFSPEDSSARYLPRVEGRLYRNAHVPVTVAIHEGGRLKQVTGRCCCAVIVTTFGFYQLINRNASSNKITYLLHRYLSPVFLIFF